MGGNGRMTPQETIETIKIAIAEVEWNYPMNYAEAFKNAISALEKHIPKKPKSSRSTSGTMWGKKIKTKHFACPFCKSIFLFAKDEVKGNCCKFCGQVLDWGEEE